jgi:hypothetical protein
MFIISDWFTITVRSDDPPDEIWYIEELHDINMSGYSVLMRDLDFQNDSHYVNATANKTGFTTGSGWDVVGTFSGCLDGQNYSVTNLFSNRAGDYGGLFRLVTGTIKNIYLKDVNITISGNHAGAIAGYLSTNGILSNCHSSGNITGSEYIGGIGGYSYRPASVNNCSSNAYVYGVGHCGGLFGMVDEASSMVFVNCYARGNVTRLSGSDGSFGGFAGQAVCVATPLGTFINCYSTGPVHYVGGSDPTTQGFFGSASYGVSTINCYFDMNTSGQTSDSKATGKTTSEMKNITMYLTNNWDISYESSFIEVNDLYPQLGSYVDGGTTWVIFRPDGITNDSAVFDTGDQELVLNWTKGNCSDYTLIRRSSVSYPTSITDGTLVYNDTGVGTEDTGLTAAYLYTAWAYNSTWDRYSEPLYFNWTASWLNCYNENNASNITCWRVEISNANGSEVYLAECCNNSHIINISDMPTGYNVIFVFSADDYEPRSYIMDVFDVVNLNAYLSPEKNDETLQYSSAAVTDPNADITITLICEPDHVIVVQGWNESLYGHWYTIPETNYTIDGSTIIVNESWLDENTTMVQAQYYCAENVLDYIIHVVNEANIGLDAVTVDVKRLIGESYQTVTYGLTDGNGDITINLIPYQIYKLQLSKTDYVTSVADYLPSESVRTKTFTLTRVSPVYPNESTVDSTINITASLLMNETIHVTYTDILDDTTTITICVYRNESMTLIDCYTVDDTSSVSYYFTDINTTYEYQVVFVYTHGRFGTITDIRYLTGRPMITDTDEFEDLFDIFGDNPFGWSSCVGFLVLCAGVFSFGRRNSGVALIVTGGVMLFIEFTVGITMIGLPLGVLFIIVGVLLQWKNTSRESGYY